MAKPEGTTLSGVSEQTAKYLTVIPSGLPKVQESPPFSYESTGTETPTDEQIKNVEKELVKSACVPFDSSNSGAF